VVLSTSELNVIGSASFNFRFLEADTRKVFGDQHFIHQKTVPHRNFSSRSDQNGAANAFNVTAGLVRDEDSMLSFRPFLQDRMDKSNFVAVAVTLSGFICRKRLPKIASSIITATIARI